MFGRSGGLAGRAEIPPKTPCHRRSRALQRAHAMAEEKRRKLDIPALAAERDALLA